MDIHIVCLDNPSPPIYGGAIDMYYKILALSRAGFRPILHIFHKGGKKIVDEKLRACSAAVFFYRREEYVHHLFGNIPYFIRSRPVKVLAQRIRVAPAPILIEGVHCGELLLTENLGDLPVILRAHNYETGYYFELAVNEDNWLRKYYYINEAQKLKRYEPIAWKKADFVASISKEETYRIEESQPATEWVPAFISENFPPIKPVISQEPAILFHGNFDVRENRLAGEWLMQVILPRLTPSYELWLAGKDVPSHWKESTRVKIFHNPENMSELVRKAGLVVVPIRQRSGVKLKYLESLNYNLRVLSSGEAVVGTGLERDAVIFEGIRDTVDKIERAFRGEYDMTFQNLQRTFRKLYDNDANALKLKNVLLSLTKNDSSV